MTCIIAVERNKQFVLTCRLVFDGHVAPANARTHAEQAVLHVAARGGAAQHPGGEADRGPAAAAEAEAGPAASPAAVAAGVVGAPRQAARRRHRGPRPRPLRGLHRPTVSRRRARRHGRAARNHVLLRGRRQRDRSHHRHVLRHGTYMKTLHGRCGLRSSRSTTLIWLRTTGRRDERRAGGARADDPAGDGVPGGSDASVEHRHRLAGGCPIALGRWMARRSRGGSKPLG